MSHSKRFVPIVLLTLSACGLVTGVRDRVRATVAVDRTVVPLGTSVAVTVKVFNDGPDTVTAANPGIYACTGAFVVTDSVGRDVGPLPRLCSLIGYTDVKLAPGDSIVMRDTWAPQTVSVSGAVTPLPAGSYRITARASVGGRELGSDPVHIVVVRTLSL